MRSMMIKWVRELHTLEDGTTFARFFRIDCRVVECSLPVLVFHGVGSLLLHHVRFYNYVR